MYRILGIDLAAKDRNPTGICYYNEGLHFSIVHRDEEIFRVIENLLPEIVVIDAPLSLEKVPFRDSERELLKRGFRPMPLTIKSIRELSERAIRIKEKIEKEYKIKVLETFPRAVERILGFNFHMFKEYFRSKHIYDAWLCYLTGLFYKIGKYEDLKGIVLPKIK
ncbi:MAG: hypothetical protein BXU00_00495 [Candidatus Nanoclepta minutus]|uniref:DUF429 domain-containing protein n=1 Tax=Candidatus Nanoclepta minutus TaxID=1940235 RepID=A0A397WR83_9ARCH|nr:MAG: hypothetical protein BXU00_00495 [Candidatus Nanoclepta minutus]